jgi:hypothetical protein
VNSERKRNLDTLLEQCSAMGLDWREKDEVKIAHWKEYNNFTLRVAKPVNEDALPLYHVARLDSSYKAGVSRMQFIVDSWHKVDSE